MGPFYWHPLNHFYYRNKTTLLVDSGLYNVGMQREMQTAQREGKDTVDVTKLQWNKLVLSPSWLPVAAGAFVSFRTYSLVDYRGQECALEAHH